MSAAARHYGILPFKPATSAGGGYVPSGNNHEPKRDWIHWLAIGLISSLGLITVGLIVAALVMGSNASGDYHKAWNSGKAPRPEAVKLIRGDETLRPVPQSVGTPSDWWSTCRVTLCDDVKVDNYPTIVYANDLHLERNCQTIKSGSQADSIMVASTKGRAFTASFADNGNIKVCTPDGVVQKDGIVIWVG